MRANPYQRDPLDISRQFLERVQWIQPAGTQDPGDGWLQLPDTGSQAKIWEHASWILSSDLSDGLLRDAVEPDSYVIDDRSWSSQERVQAVAQTPGEFVALLSPGRRFERLVNRQSLLEMLGAAQS
jgi:hypothetical protein